METYPAMEDLPLPDYDSTDSLAIKIHMGERGNKTHVRPDDVGRLVQRVKSAGADVFITDTTTLYQRKRANVKDYLETAALNGFTEDSVGCPVVIANAKGGRKVGRIWIAEGLFEANTLIILSHATGHITAGFAGAIKNVAMGCVTKRGKRYIHGAAWPRYREGFCKKCGNCVKACPFGFITLGDRIKLNLKDCPACERCLDACNAGGFWRPPEAMEECYNRYAETCEAVLSRFPGTIFINELNRVTRFCDCSASPEPVISPDLGFLVSGDPVEIDKESVRVIVDSSPEASKVFGIKWERFIQHVSSRMLGKVC